MTYTLGELASLINAELHGDQDIKITNIATLTSAGSGDISFLANRRYVNQLADTSASAVVLGPDDMNLCPVAGLVVEDPHLSFARIVQLFHPPEAVQAGIDKSAHIDTTSDIAATAFIGPHVVIGMQTIVNDNVSIGAGCVIGDSVTIGDNCRLYPNVFIGNNSVIRSHTVIYAGNRIGRMSTQRLSKGRVRCKCCRKSMQRLKRGTQIHYRCLATHAAGRCYNRGKCKV